MPDSENSDSETPDSESPVSDSGRPETSGAEAAGSDPSGAAIAAVGQIHLTVEDLGGMVGFYRDVLGLDLLFEVPEQSMAFFQCGDLRLYLGPAEGLERPSHPLLYYEVADIDATVRAVESRGAAPKEAAHVVHRTEAMELWMASFEDPEGNLVVLMEERRLA